MVTLTAAAYGQSSQPDRTDPLSRMGDRGMAHDSDISSTDSLRNRTFTPESHVPQRSPDLGSAFFPLSPSIGPGSGSLGPGAGPNASRRTLNAERDRNHGGDGRRER